MRPQLAFAFIFVTVLLDSIGFGLIMPVTPQLIMDVSGDTLTSAARDSGLLMEPGSGVPDVKKIMEKVRAGQKAGTTGGKPAPGQSDMIAAARRAAQAAAQEAGAQKFTQPAAKGKIKGAKGDKFTAGRLGERSVEDNGIVVLGPPTKFNKDNIDSAGF